jgi:hypothetical protein
MLDSFCVFILTYKRADNVKTVKTLRNSGYTGPVYLVCSTDDPQLADYEANFPGQVCTFDKQAVGADKALQNEWRGILFARLACFNIAKELGFDYFLELDDDYSDISYRFDDELNYRPKTLYKSADYIFDTVLEFFKAIPAKTVAFAQGGDFIGGKDSGLAQKVQTKRKAMNTFFCKTNDPVRFRGVLNEDVNTYTTLGRQGEILLTLNQISISQQETQQSEGGITETYLDSGTYVKSFVTVMYAPSCTTITLMGNKNLRLHHKIAWDKCSPKIVSEFYRKD